METEVPEILEGRTYRITYDVVIASTTGKVNLSNHGVNNTNIGLIGETVVGTYSVDWLQGANNIKKIELWNSTLYNGAIDNISVSQIPITIFNNVKINYIKKPSKPNWSYVVVNNKPLYNSTLATNFELHLSEESELVYRILAFAGIAIEKPQLTQIAAGLEQAKVQQEKQ